MSSEKGKSLTGLGLRNKAKGDKITGLGIRDKAKGAPITTFGIRKRMGGKKDDEHGSDEHASRPLHTLKDPSSFGPPPKNVNYPGGTVQSNQMADRRGLGAPLTREEIQHEQYYEADEEEAQREAEEAARLKRLQPYRADTTGLSTAHLLPPPGRKDGADGRTPLQIMPPPGNRDAAGGRPPPPLPSSRGKPPPPGLPPRLPPRQNSTPLASPDSTNSEPDAHRGILNQGALNRLGNAGVSVPGFEIGSRGRAPILPPPRAASPRDSLPNPAAKDNSQLNELQSRFSRLSPSSPKPESSSQGTTWAQKQAALKTASSFRNDPSSVSLQDAKSAATTANNFRDRHGEQVKTAASTANNFRDKHGEQVKSGWQSANKLNTKYGVAEKVGGYGQPTEPVSPQIQMRDNTTTPPVGGLGKKKPPPPPAKKAQFAGNSVGGPGLPPPLPLSSKPKPSLSRPGSNAPNGNQQQSHELDLSLATLWFAKSPVILPPSIIGTQGKKLYASSSSWSSTGTRKTHTFTTIVQDHGDLSRNLINLTWDASNPGVTVQARQRYIPPPPKPSWGQLEAWRQSYSDAVATWCESKMGRQVGNGECWTLADEGLKAVAQNCKAHGTEPCLPSQSYIHGALIYSFISTDTANPEALGGILETGVARGDVIQILSAVLKSRDGRRTGYAGDPDHTAVITSVEANGILKVVESNVGGVKNVKRGSYDMSELVKGEVRIYRAVGESWLGKLDPTW